MYNLNYNVTNCRLNKPQGRPFVPSPRYDPYSASLVLAIPGQIFYSGYYNVFNMTFPYNDISAYIRNGEFNDSTNQFNKTGKLYDTAFTGSLGLFGTSSLGNFQTNFTSSGYEYCTFLSGGTAIKVENEALTGVGVNLGTASAWTIETWAAFDVTSSFITSSAGTGSQGNVINAFPTRQIAQKYTDGVSDSSSYYFVAGYTGDNFYPLDSVFSGIVTGSVLGTVTTKAGIITPPTQNVDEVIFPYQLNKNIWSGSYNETYKFNHYAFTYTPTGSNGGIYRTYFNGGLVNSEGIAGPMNQIPNINTLLFGETTFGNPASASLRPAMYIQDFRMYNGTNKNYTGSQFPVPQSMIIAKKEPYPSIPS